MSAQLKKIKQSNRYKNKPWILIIDTTHRKRFGKLLENLIKYKGEQSNSGTYAFVWPLLVAPDGTRINFPPPIWYSPDFAREYGFTRKTQPQIAVAFLKLLAKRLDAINCRKKLIVLADSAFENKNMWKICNRLNWTFVTSCKEDRCLSDGGKVHHAMSEVPEKKRNICPSKVLDICFRSKQETGNTGYSSHRYAYYKKQLSVADAGTLSVVRSHKLKYRSQLICQASYRVLLCNDLSLSPQYIISLYAFRWQCETFFREQKSHLHFNDFHAHCFRACWRFVNLLAVIFNFLEFFRLELITNGSFTNESPDSFQSMRTTTLKSIFQRHAFVDSVTWLLQRAQTPFGCRRIKQALRALSLPFKGLPLSH